MLFLSLLCVFVIIINNSNAQSYLEHAKALMRLYPLIDGHNDLPWQARTQVNNQWSRLNISNYQPSLQTDMYKHI